MTLPGRIAVCITCLFALFSSLRAQGARISLGDIVEGSLAAGEIHRFVFNALEFTLISLRVESADGALDPVIELFDSSDQLIHASDDYDYPATRDAAIQAFVLPKTSTYSIALSGHAGSSGDYRLHFLPGYDRLTLYDATMDKNNWQVVYSDTAIDVSESSLYAVELEGFARSAGVLGEHFPQAQDLFFQATFHEVTSAADWNVGLLFRYIDSENYHRILLSKTGYWRLDRVENGERAPLKSWSTHPAIRPGEKDFRLGILASGQHIDAVYNGQVIGSASDSAAPQDGGLGIAMRTDEVTGGLMSFAVLETLLTLPSRVDERIPFPQRVVERQTYLMARDLARKQLAPAGRSVSFVQPESSVRHVRPGVTRIAIASDRSYEQFALGASLELVTSEAGNGGCGIFFHFNDDNHYTLAYLTNEGDFGVSRRTGAAFEAGIYGRRAPLLDAAEHYLLVIATDEELHYFVDEAYAGSMPSQPRTGSIGIAVVNYEAVETTCRFTDLWVQNFDA